MSDREIMRRTSRYPPEMLHHMGLITQEECRNCWSFEKSPYYKYFLVVAYG